MARVLCLRDQYDIVRSKLQPDWAPYSMLLLPLVAIINYLLINSVKSLSEGHKPVGQPTAAKLLPLHTSDAHLRIQ